MNVGGEISRCRETNGQDGRAFQIRWTIADELCLNGTRLVPTKGKQGEPWTEYHPQTAPLVRVVGIGSSVETLSGFIVYTPAGRQTLYGALPPNDWTLESVQWAQHDGQRIPLSWHMARVRDLAKNEMRYRYAGEPSDENDALVPRAHRLTAIEYGLNETAGTPMTRQMVLEYSSPQSLLHAPKAWESPALVHQGYLAGMSYTRGQVLTRVEMQVKDAQEWKGVRQYRLRYEAIPGETPNATADSVRLVSLQECGETQKGYGNDPTACFHKTSFEWSQHAATLEPLPGFGMDGVPFYPIPPAGQLKTAIYARIGMEATGDFDGDGDDDRLVMPELMNTSDTADRWQLWVTDPGLHAPLSTNLATWAAQGKWTNRAGTVVPEAGSVGAYVSNGEKQVWTVRSPEQTQTGVLRDEKAVPGVWSMNYDGTGGTDVLMGEPVRELAGIDMDPPWGVGWKTGINRYFASQANNDPQSKCSLMLHGQPENTTFEDCWNDLNQSKADYKNHPGIMKVAAAPGASARQDQTDPGYFGIGAGRENRRSVSQDGE